MEKIQIYHAGSSAINRILQHIPLSAHRIILFKQDNGSILIDTDAYELPPKGLIFAYPEQRIELHPQQAMEIWCIAFEETFFYVQTEHKDLLFRSPFFSYMLPFPVQKLLSSQFDSFAELFNTMHFELKHVSDFTDRILLSYLNIVLLKIKQFKWARNNNVHQNDYTTLQLVVRYKQLIRMHCHEQHSVKWYADELRITSNYLNLMVKKVCDVTAGDLISNQLTLEAKRQLMHTKLSPKEVAFALGFYDHSYFTKFFKKQTGYSPLEWFNRNK